MIWHSSRNWGLETGTQIVIGSSCVPVSAPGDLRPNLDAGFLRGGSGRIEDVSPECRYGFPRRLISRFQRQGDVNLGGEEHRHVAQSGTELDRLNERLGKGAADVRDQGQRSVRG